MLEGDFDAAGIGELGRPHTNGSDGITEIIKVVACDREHVRLLQPHAAGASRAAFTEKGWNGTFFVGQTGNRQRKAEKNGNIS